MTGSAPLHPSVMPPRDMPDAILFAARLARGLTLLTQGTAYDLATQQYLNPSDWKDRGLTEFVVDDHVMITQDDQAQTRHSLVLYARPFEIRHRRTGDVYPSRHPGKTANEFLAESAYEILRIGQSPKVGPQSILAPLSRTITIANHRTAAPAGRMLGFRNCSKSLKLLTVAAFFPMFASGLRPVRLHLYSSIVSTLPG